MISTQQPVFESSERFVALGIILWLVRSNNAIFYFSRNLDGLTSKDREVASLRRQVDATSDELTETGRQREVALRENRRLQDDLATMTRENQVCIL